MTVLDTENTTMEGVGMVGMKAFEFFGETV